MSVLNPTTFLEFTQRVSSECGIPGSGPSALSGATGQNQMLFQWVAQAYSEIQTKHPDWRFMLVRPGVSFATVGSQIEYTPMQAGISAGTVGAWRTNTFRRYLTSAGQSSEVRMTYYDYDTWRDRFNIGSLRTSAVDPVVFTVSPEKYLLLQCPLAGYTITGEYYRSPEVFDADGDVSILPVELNLAIVYQAMMYYGHYESAPEIFNRGETGYNRLMKRFEKLWLPTIRGAGSLA